MLQNKKRASWKWLFLGLAILLIALPLAGCGKDDNASGNNTGAADEPKDTGKVVATYKGGKVTDKQLTSFLGAHKFFSHDPMYAYYEMMPEFKESLLRQLIATRLLVDDLDKKDKDESADQAKKDVDEMEKSIKSDEASKKQFDQVMDELNIKTDDLAAYMASQYSLQKYFEKKYTETEVKKKYDEEIAKNKNAYVSTATVRHILVKLTDEAGKEVRTKEEALKRAAEVQLKLKNGGDWVALAKEYSDDPGSKDNGGQYADANIDGWVENFRKHAIEQPIGEIGEPFETEHGYHVMVVEKRNPNDYASVKGTVKGQMANEFFTKYIQDELPKLDTKIDLPKEEPAATAPEEGDAGADAEAGNAGADAEAGNDSGKDAEAKK